MLKENDYANFYYNAGIYMGRYFDYNFGKLSFEKKCKVVSDFKKFVESCGGVDSFRDSKMAVKQFFFKISKGRKNVG